MITDPQVPFESDDALSNLEEKLETSIAQTGRRIRIGNSGDRSVNINLEVVFVFDLSENVTNDDLEKAIIFSETYLKKVILLIPFCYNFKLLSDLIVLILVL